MRCCCIPGSIEKMVVGGALIYCRSCVRARQVRNMVVKKSCACASARAYACVEVGQGCLWMCMLPVCVCACFGVFFSPYLFFDVTDFLLFVGEKGFACSNVCAFRQKQ